MASLFDSLHPSCYRGGTCSFGRVDSFFIAGLASLAVIDPRRLFVLLAPPVVPPRTHMLVRPGGFFFCFFYMALFLSLIHI